MSRIDLETTDCLEREKRELLKVAKQLCYSDEIIQSIKNAKTVYELDRIMKSARESK